MLSYCFLWVFFFFSAGHPHAYGQVDRYTDSMNSQEMHLLLQYIIANFTALQYYHLISSSCGNRSVDSQSVRKKLRYCLN